MPMDQFTWASAEAAAKKEPATKAAVAANLHAERLMLTVAFPEVARCRSCNASQEEKVDPFDAL
ncbi:hypothetical protein [Variovorax sp. J31P179]|uniref:hypothetical protein n=1 Tax=Variovorax sp. J31P179 TaxID=3053508 RepID=UPI002575139C|nr:hypothetical protein [Variovorax sp. J31P179]